MSDTTTTATTTGHAGSDGCCGNPTPAAATVDVRATQAAGTSRPVPHAPCCGTAAEAATADACCGTAAKADAVAAGTGCCG